MNKCRECGKSIPERFNGSLALRCSGCRKEKDQELREIRDENAKLEAENEQRNLMFSQYRVAYEKQKSQYELLRQTYTTTMNDNERLNKDNNRLIEGIERLFEQNEVLKKELEAIKGIVALNDGVVEKCLDLSMYEDTHEKAIEYLENNYVIGDEDLYARIANTDKKADLIEDLHN